MTNSERTRAVASEAIVGALLCIAGFVLAGLSGIVVAIGIALLTLGAMGLAHVATLGLGLINLPDNTRDSDRDDGD